MAQTEDRFMVLLIFFDLPTTTQKAKRDYMHFRKFLKQDGFMMLQLSVYARVCKGQKSIDTHLKRTKEALPSDGNVRSLEITEMQYARMKTLIGKKKKQEEIASKQLILL